MSSIHLIKQLKEEKIDKQETEKFNLKTETKDEKLQAATTVDIWKGHFIKFGSSLKYVKHE